MTAERLERTDGLRIAALLSGNVLGVMLIAAVNPALGGIARHFADQTDNAEFLTRVALLAPAIFVAIGSPIAGMIADRFGRRRLFIGSILLYAAAGAISALSPTIEVLLGARVLQGLATAGVTTAGAILVGDYFTGQARMRVIGWQSAAISGGAVVFLLLSGVLATLSWQAPFWLYVAAAAVSLLLVLATIKEPELAARDAASRDARRGGAGAGTWALALLAGVTSAALFLPPIHAPFLFAEAGVEDPRLLAIALAALSLFGAISSMLFPWLSRRMSFAGLFALVFAFTAAGAVCLATLEVFAGLVAAMALFGFGVGLMFPTLLAIAIANSNDETRARAVARMNGGVFTGESASPFVSEPIRIGLGVPGLFLAAAGLLAAMGLGALVVAVTKGRRRATSA